VAILAQNGPFFKKLGSSFYLHPIPSLFRRICLLFIPPANPPSLFAEVSTRWHGTTIDIGLLPTAVPTARTAFGLPIALAIVA